MYTFNYKISEDDYYNFNLYNSMNTPSIRKQINLNRYMYPVIYMLMAALYAIFSKNYVFPFIVSGSISALWLLYYINAPERNLRSFINKTKKDGNLSYRENGTLTFNDEYIVDASPTLEIKMPYSSITKIAHDSLAFYLYYSVSEAFIVPFSVFRADSEKQEFLEFITHKLNNSQKV